MIEMLDAGEHDGAWDEYDSEAQAYAAQQQTDLIVHEARAEEDALDAERRNEDYWGPAEPELPY